MVEMTDRFGRTTKNQVGIIEYANGKEFLKKGGDLNDFMQIVQPDEDIFKNIIRDILQGLDYLGKRNIIHRDLKPANILVHKNTEGEWMAKIADFGLSKNLDNSASSSQGFKGTIEYMAPEQLYRKKYAVEENIQTNADLWAFGIVLYELFAREIPVGRRSEGSTVEDIMENLDLFEPNQLVLQNIPMPYRNMIQVCLIKFPEQRVQTASKLLKMLESPTTLASIPTSEDTLYSVPQKPKQQPISAKPVPPPKPKQKKKQSWLFLIPIFILMGIVGLWANGVFSDSKSTNTETTDSEQRKIDSIETAKKDSIEVAQLTEKEDTEEARRKKEDAEEARRKKEDNNEVFTIVEDMPEFPGGQKALFRFIGKTISYPPLARKNGIEGTVYVGFIVEKTGEFSNVKIKRGLARGGEGCDAEAIRVVKSSPKWIPGKQRGKPVRVAFTLPIRFKIE